MRANERTTGLWPLSWQDLASPRRPRSSHSRLALVRDLIFGVSGVVVAAVVVWLESSGRTQAGTAVANSYGGLVAVVGGFLLMILGIGPSTVRKFRILLGTGVILSMVPSVAFVFQWGVPVPVLMTCTVLGVCFVILGVVDRVSVTQRYSWLRGILEAVGMGCLFALGVWTSLWRDIVPQDRVTQNVIILVVDGFVFGTTALSLSRGKDKGLSFASVGACGIITATLVRSAADWQNVAPGVWSTVLYTLCWPVVLVGLFRATPLAATILTDTDAKDERRALVTVTSLAVGAVGFSMWNVAREGGDTATYWLAAVCVVLIWARELVRARQSHDLLNGLARQSRRDALTGLRNLRSLDETLRKLAQADNPATLTAVSVNVERFRDLNALHGRAVGDNMLRGLARELESLGERRAKVYRVGANEFVLLGSLSEVSTLEDQLVVAVEQAAADVPGATRLGMVARAGMAHLEISRATTEEELRLLISRSSLAMHESKLASRNLTVFEESLEADQLRRWDIEKVLRDSSSDWLEVRFQPVFSLEAGELSSVEALARMEHPTLGTVSPTEFIRVAEDAGLMDTVGGRILNQAMAGAVESGLIAAGKPLAVNVSTTQLRNPSFPMDLLAQLRRHRVPVDQLVLEVTESVFVRGDDPAIDTLTLLHLNGVKVVLDDFGTGYSTLSYLTRLPVNGLKIDRSITCRLEDDRTMAIARGIHSLALDLDFDIVIEGVETYEQERLVRQLGECRVQGWLYAKALTVSDLANLLGREVRLPDHQPATTRLPSSPTVITPDAISRLRRD